MAGSPDLFVVCKSCSSEVSPYITECPYCGSRLRKRAPKIDREEDGNARPRESRRMPRPTLGPLRTGEIPGIRGDELRRPYATIVLVALGIAGYLVLSLLDSRGGTLSVYGPVHNDWWRYISTTFLYSNGWFQLASVTAIALYGWLLERRHGPIVVVALYLLCGVGGIVAAAALVNSPFVMGGNGAALGLLAAWAVPILIARRRGEEDDADMLGTAVFAVVLVVLPTVTYISSQITGNTGFFAGLIGLGAGALAGLGLAKVSLR